MTTEPKAPTVEFKPTHRLVTKDGRAMDAVLCDAPDWAHEAVRASQWVMLEGGSQFSVRKDDRLEPIEPSLWCIHVYGPDTLIAQPDEETAMRRAHEWNKAIPKPSTPHEPLILCVAEPWTWSAEGHAKALAEHGGEPEDIC